MKLFRTFAILVLLAAAAVGAFLYYSGTAYAGFREEQFVEIPKGTSTAGIARLLLNHKVIRTQWEFYVVRALQPRAKLQAGEYHFDKAASVWEVFDRIRRGDVFLYRVSIPEGYSMFEIADAVAQTGVIPKDAFLSAARDAGLIRDLAPGATSLEGFLFPDTYRFPRNTSAHDLCRQMTERFRVAWRRLEGTGDVGSVVTMASLIEKETGNADERPLVSAVIHNRLRLGMPLQIDPSVIYAARLEGSYRGEIRQSDLARQSAYNTYQRSGLPPGPISNPGLESLKAALHPSQSPYLYFVARPDGSGTHVFSADLAAHNRAVERYRRGLRQTDQKAPIG